MNQTQQIQDAIMALKAQHHKDKMYGVIRARQAFRIEIAEKAGECLFDAAGEADRMAMDGFAHA